MLLDLLFPKTCFSCGSFGSYVCVRCAQRLEQVPFDICPQCRRKCLYGLTHEYCKEKVSISGLLSIYFYRSTFGKIIKGVKYQCVKDGLSNLFHTFPPKRKSDIISVAALIGAECIIPIPLHDSRFKKRGFNQAGVIASFIAHVTGLPVRNDILWRVKQTEQQARAHIAADRFQNIKGAFATRKRIYNTMPKSIILIDDVWTTGSTIKEAAHILKEDGCKNIFAVTLAR